MVNCVLWVDRQGSTRCPAKNCCGYLKGPGVRGRGARPLYGLALTLQPRTPFLYSLSPLTDVPDLPPNQHLLLSGSADNTIRVWLVTYHTPPAARPPSSPSSIAAPPEVSWEALCVLQGHTGPVSSLAVHRLRAPGAYGSNTASSSASSSIPDAGAAAPGSQHVDDPGSLPLLLVSTAADADVLVWECGPGGQGGGQEGTTADAAAGAGQAAEAGGLQGAAAGGPSDAASGSAGAARVGPASGCGRYGQGCWRLAQRLHVGTRMQLAAAMTELTCDPGWWVAGVGWWRAGAAAGLGAVAIRGWWVAGYCVCEAGLGRAGPGAGGSRCCPAHGARTAGWGVWLPSAERRSNQFLVPRCHADARLPRCIVPCSCPWGACPSAALEAPSLY